MATVLAKDFKADGFARIAVAHAVCVVVDGQEVQWFHNAKDAGAWVQHTYGPIAARLHGDAEALLPTGRSKLYLSDVCDLCHIQINHIGDRPPAVGDAVVYDGSGDFYSAGWGVLDTICGDLAATLSPSAYREAGHVSCSGGPCPFIKPEDLTLVGLHDQRFWRWHRGHAGASEGGDYYMCVPLWQWNGKEDLS